MLLWFN